MTKCYHNIGMSEDLVIFIRCNSVAEKRAFVKAAHGRGIPLSRFAREAMAAQAKFSINEELCQHCGAHLAKNNESGFCRKCLRTIGITKLRNLHPR